MHWVIRSLQGSSYVLHIPPDLGGRRQKGLLLIPTPNGVINS